MFSCKRENDYNFDNKVDSKEKFWTSERVNQYNKNLNDSTKWDYEMFNNDLIYVEEKTMNPIEFGVFPVAKYDLLGENSFKGLGSIGNSKKVKNKNLIYSAFYIKKNELNKDILIEKKNNVFFNIIILTDTLDIKNYNLKSSMVISRNHPNYIGQGFVKTKFSKIDYTSFITIEGDSYAIVNMRLFNLKYGKTILIAPQKDKSMRSFQINMPIIESNELESYINNLLLKPEIINFYTKYGNI